MKNLLYYLFIVILSLCNLTLSAQGIDKIDDKPLYDYEQMPQFPGGDEGLLNFIKNNLKYPVASAKAGVEGRVTVRFVVGIDGTVSDVIVMRGLDSLCNQEAVRVVKLMPVWTPGKYAGKKVPIYYTLPIVYKLQKGTSDVKPPLLNVDGTSVDKSPLVIVDGAVMPYSITQDTNQLKPSNIKHFTVLNDSTAMADWGSKGANGVILIEAKSGAAKRDSLKNAEKPEFGVEVMPQFPGGENALMAFIKNNLRYPHNSAKVGIEGRVIIRFVVTKTGKVSDIKVIRGLDAACDAEAVRVINLMPNWIPGIQKGKPVNVYYTLPFVYKLQR